MRSDPENRGRRGLWTMLYSLALFLATTMFGCGADSDVGAPTATSNATQEAAAARSALVAAGTGRRAAPLAAAPQASGPYGGVAAADAVAQLFEYAESKYPAYFPGHKATQSYAPYLYRYYPETGRYVGVAVNVPQGAAEVEAGVYVLGGDFGSSPTYVGQLTSFVVPKPVLHYTDVVYAIWGRDGVPFKVTKSGVELAKNMTPYSLLYFCGLKDPDVLGRIGLLCQDSPSTIQRKLYIDPIANEIHEDTGTPVRSEYVFAADFDPKAPLYRTKAVVSDGIFFTTDATYSRIDFRSEATGKVSTVAEGTFDTTGTVKYMRAFNN